MLNAQALLRSHGPILSNFIDPCFPLRCNICHSYITGDTFSLELARNHNYFQKIAYFHDFLTKRLFCHTCYFKISSQILDHLNSCNHCGSTHLGINCTCKNRNPITQNIRIRSLLNYTPEIRVLIHKIKFQPSIDICNWISLFLLKMLPALFLPTLGVSRISWDSISFVPSRIENIRRRGGYSTLIIANTLGKLVGDLPLIFTENISSHRQTSIQSSKRFNAKRVYSFKNSSETSSYSRTLILDDMLTTGSSALSLTKELLKLNPQNKIDILTISRAPDFHKNYFKTLERC